MDEVKGIAISLRTVVGQGYQCGLKCMNDRVDGPVTRDRFTKPCRQKRGLTVYSRGRQVRFGQCEPFNELLKGRGHLPLVPIAAGLAAEPRESALAVMASPTSKCAQHQIVVLSDAGQGNTLLQVRPKDPEPLKCLAAVLLAQAICACMWLCRHDLCRIIE